MTLVKVTVFQILQNFSLQILVSNWKAIFSSVVKMYKCYKIADTSVTSDKKGGRLINWDISNFYANPMDSANGTLNNCSLHFY